MSNIQILFERRPVPSENDASTIIGTSFESTIIVDGIPHHSARFYGTDEQINERERTIAEQIRSAVVEIVK
jgi:hypothetical protein